MCKARKSQTKGQLRRTYKWWGTMPGNVTEVGLREKRRS